LKEVTLTENERVKKRGQRMRDWRNKRVKVKTARVRKHKSDKKKEESEIHQGKTE
jgi:hypothetical protein